MSSSRKQSAKGSAKKPFNKPEHCLSFEPSEMIDIISVDGFTFTIDKRCACYAKKFKQGRFCWIGGS